MKYTNILEKLICLINITKTNWVNIIFLCFVALILILLGVKKISRKNCFRMILIGYFILLGYTIFIYNKELGTIGNSIIDDLFTNIYFPSTYVYLFILIVMDITTFVSFINFRGSKVYQWVHGIFFFILQFILIPILELLSKNKIDIFSKTSLFSNKELVMLLELSVNVFVIWLVTIVFIYVTNIITEKISLSSVKVDTPKETKYTPVNMDTLVADINMNDNASLQPETTLPKKEFVQSVESSVLPDVTYTENTSMNQFIPTMNVNYNNNLEATIHQMQYTTTNQNIQTTSQTLPEVKIINANTIMAQENKTTNNIDNSFNLSDLVPKKQDTIIPEPMTSDVIFEHILNNDLPMIQKEEVVDTNTDSYTLNDYRLFNKMLKEIKDHNQNNTVTIDKDLEYRLITKYSSETYDMFKKMLKIYSN